MVSIKILIMDSQILAPTIEPLGAVVCIFLNSRTILIIIHVGANWHLPAPFSVVLAHGWSLIVPT